MHSCMSHIHTFVIWLIRDTLIHVTSNYSWHICLFVTWLIRDISVRDTTPPFSSLHPSVPCKSHTHTRAHTRIASHPTRLYDMTTDTAQLLCCVTSSPDRVCGAYHPNGTAVDPTYCNTHCNTLQHTASHGNTAQLLSLVAQIMLYHFDDSHAHQLITLD